MISDIWYILYHITLACRAWWIYSLKHSNHKKQPLQVTFWFAEVIWKNLKKHTSQIYWLTSWEHNKKTTNPRFPAVDLFSANQRFPNRVLQGTGSCWWSYCCTPPAFLPRFDIHWRPGCDDNQRQGSLVDLLFNLMFNIVEPTFETMCHRDIDNILFMYWL